MIEGNVVWRTVAKEGLEISVSSHFVNPNKMKNKLMEFERAYTKETLLPNSSEMRLTEHQSDVPDLLPTQGNNVSSAGKDTQSSNNEQGSSVKNQETDAIPTDEEVGITQSNSVLQGEEVDNSRGDNERQEQGRTIEVGTQGEVENGFVHQGAQGGVDKQGNPINADVTLKVEKVKQEPQPIGYGDFGAIYDQFKGKANEAIKFLLSKQDGEAIAALHHKDIGNIDLVWGKEGTAKSDGFGLAKLAKYHPEVLDNLQEILEDMIVTKRTDNRVQLESEKYQSAVRLTWDSKKKNWLLTMFEKKNSVLNNTTDTDKTQIGNENDTATLENAALSDGKDTEKTPNSKGNKKKVVSSHMEGNLFDEAPSLTNKDKDDEDNQRTRRENRRSDDGVSPRESSGRRTAEPGQLDANPTERRTERQGNSGVQSRNAEVRSSTGRPSGRLSRLNTTNNHAERGVDYAPTSVDARIEANIKAYR